MGCGAEFHPDDIGIKRLEWPKQLLKAPFSFRLSAHIVTTQLFSQDVMQTLGDVVEAEMGDVGSSLIVGSRVSAESTYLTYFFEDVEVVTEKCLAGSHG